MLNEELALHHASQLERLSSKVQALRLERHKFHEELSVKEHSHLYVVKDLGAQLMEVELAKEEAQRDIVQLQEQVEDTKVQSCMDRELHRRELEEQMALTEEDVQRLRNLRDGKDAKLAAYCQEERGVQQRLEVLCVEAAQATEESGFLAEVGKSSEESILHAARQLDCREEERASLRAKYLDAGHRFEEVIARLEEENAASIQPLRIELEKIRNKVAKYNHQVESAGADADRTETNIQACRASLVERAQKFSRLKGVLEAERSKLHHHEMQHQEGISLRRATRKRELGDLIPLATHRALLEDHASRFLAELHAARQGRLEQAHPANSLQQCDELAQLVNEAKQHSGRLQRLNEEEEEARQVAATEAQEAKVGITAARKELERRAGLASMLQDKMTEKERLCARVDLQAQQLANAARCHDREQQAEKTSQEELAEFHHELEQQKVLVGLETQVAAVREMWEQSEATKRSHDRALRHIAQVVTTYVVEARSCVQTLRTSVSEDVCSFHSFLAEWQQRCSLRMRLRRDEEVAFHEQEAEEAAMLKELLEEVPQTRLAVESEDAAFLKKAAAGRPNPDWCTQDATQPPRESLDGRLQQRPSTPAEPPGSGAAAAVLRRELGVYRAEVKHLEITFKKEVAEQEQQHAALCLETRTAQKQREEEAQRLLLHARNEEACELADLDCRIAQLGGRLEKEQRQLAERQAQCTELKHACWNATWEERMERRREPVAKSHLGESQTPWQHNDKAQNALTVRSGWSGQLQAMEVCAATRHRDQRPPQLHR